MTVPTDTETGTKAADRVRAVAVGAAAAAMILVPTLGPLLAGTREGAEEFDTEITPPDYAFAIWAPIFAAGAADAVQHAVNPAAAVNRRTGWWLTGAYTANACWSIAAQSGRFRYTPFILPVAAGLAATAHRRAQHDRPRGTERLRAHSAGLLLGWTGVASVVNAFAVQRRGRFATTTRTGRNTARLAVAGAAALLSAAIATSRYGHTSIALAGTWALATSAANPARTPRTRQVNAAAAALVAATTATRLRRTGTGTVRDRRTA
ncbi:hypothetical protein ACLQ2R_14525 [Streptosporangium sp. DT93]|uniref:hypothetical protein n=1 Tax=Streptosporangium sp. DT93 TaxID=3393428 RepID=UPI003CF03FC4